MLSYRVIGLIEIWYRILDGTFATTLVTSLSDEENESDIGGIVRLFKVCAAPYFSILTLAIAVKLFTLRSNSTSAQALLYFSC